MTNKACCLRTNGRSNFERTLPLTPRDAFICAKLLDMTVEEFSERHCKRSVRNGIPVLEIDGECPFVSDGRCILEKNLPSICFSFPYGETIWFGQRLDAGDPAECDQVAEKTPCPNFLESWSTVCAIAKLCLKDVKKDEDSRYVKEAFIDILYRGYDMETPFAEQFETKKLDFVSKSMFVRGLYVD